MERVRVMRSVRRVLIGAVVVAGTVLAPVAVSNAAVVVPAPVGPWGYTTGFNNFGGGIKCNFYRVAIGNGVAEKLNGDESVECADGLTFSPAGVLYGYTIPRTNGPGAESHLVTINTTTGAQTEVGSLGRGFYEGGMTFDKDGKLWLYAEPDDESCSDAGSYNCLYSVNPATGASTLVGGSTPVRGFVATGLAASCSGVYATGNIAAGTWSDSLYSVDTATGAVTKIGALGVEMYTEGLDFAADGTLHAIGEPVGKGPLYWAPKLATVDTASGAGSNVQTWISDDETPNGIFGLAIAGLSCPAPPAPPVDVEPAFTG